MFLNCLLLMLELEARVYPGNRVERRGSEHLRAARYGRLSLLYYVLYYTMEDYARKCCANLRKTLLCTLL